MSLDVQNLGYAFLDTAGNLIDAPTAGESCLIDLAWGLEKGAQAKAVTVTLDLPEAELLPGNDFPVLHQVLTGRRAVEMGRAPDGKAVYLTDAEAAVGVWRARFPFAGEFDGELVGAGLFPVTVVARTTPFPDDDGTGEPRAGNAPALTQVGQDIFGPNFPAVVYEVAFSGTYPAGGLDLTPAMVTVGNLQFADVADTSAFRFAVDIPNRKLQVFVPGGAEASGAVSFTTRGLFIGRVC